MDYLLSKGKKFCAIKVLKRAGRIRQGDTTSFPKTVSFRCGKRPVPQNRYQVKLRGVGLADISIRTVYAVVVGERSFYVEAELTPMRGQL